MIRRPLLRWHGGKWLLSPWIVKHLPEHRAYVEPFAGAASVLMRKARSHVEVVNDLDGDLVNLFLVLRDRPDELRRQAELTLFAREEFDLAYEPCADPLERARRLLVRASMGRASASATSPWKASFRNHTGASRTTTGAHDWSNYARSIDEFSARLKGVLVENTDAIKVIRQHDAPDTLFYVDPPYPMGSRDKFRDYRHEMTDEDHEELAAVLKCVQGRVVVSGYRSALYERLYGHWRSIEEKAYADGARPRREVLWFSPSVVT